MDPPPLDMSGRERGDSGARERVATYRLSTPRSMSDAARVTPRSARLTEAVTSAKSASDIQIVPLLSAAVRCATELIPPPSDDLLQAAIEDMVPKLGKSSRHNFNKPEVEAAHLHLASQLQVQVVSQAMHHIPKVQQNLANLACVMSLGGGSCSDSLGIIKYLQESASLRKITYTSLLFRVVDPEPQWSATWEEPLAIHGVKCIDFEVRDYDCVKDAEIIDWGLAKVDFFSMAFVAKPVFRALWDETFKVLSVMMDQAKAGAFVLWINFSDAPVNRLFQRWAKVAGLIPMFEFDGMVSALKITMPFQSTVDNCRFSSLAAGNYAVTVRLMRKPKAEGVIVDPRSQNNAIAHDPPTAGDSESDSDSDSDSN